MFTIKMYDDHRFLYFYIPVCMLEEITYWPTCCHFFYFTSLNRKNKNKQANKTNKKKRTITKFVLHLNEVEKLMH